MQDDPTIEQETVPANVQTVSDAELEAMRLEKGHAKGEEPPPMTPEERHAAIQKLAHRIWETHGGVGQSHDDWAEAERLVDAGMLDPASIEKNDRTVEKH